MYDWLKNTGRLRDRIKRRTNFLYNGEEEVSNNACKISIAMHKIDF